MHEHDKNINLSQMAVDLEAVLRSYRVCCLGAQRRKKQDYVWAAEGGLALRLVVSQCGKVHFLHRHGRVHIQSVRHRHIPVS